MEFEWDQDKAARNQRKHGVPFPYASRVFLDPNRLEWADERQNYGEPRWITIGRIDDFEITVAFTLRTGSIRLISARKSTKYEREDYYNR